MNTAAIQKCIDACSGAGGGTVVVPKTGTGVFMSGALFLKKGTNLRVEKDAMLKGSAMPSDYPIIDTRFEGTERPFMSGFINASNVDGITIGGEGAIDGNYMAYSANSGRGGGWRRPRTRRGGYAGTQTNPATAPVQYNRCSHSARSRHSPSARLPRAAGANDLHRRARCSLRLPTILRHCRSSARGRQSPAAHAPDQLHQLAAVKDIHLQHQAVWCLHILYCTDILVENVDIHAGDGNALGAPSSDGMDIDSSRRVRVNKVTIQANDDCISIKSGKDADGRRVNKPCEDILIENCHMAYGQGGVAMGSEVSGTIRNVEVRDTLIDSGNWAPIRFKSQPTRGGIVENIVYRNIKVADVRQFFDFNLNWTATSSSGPRMPTTVRNVYVINVTGTARSGGAILGLPDSPITNILFKDCDISANTGVRITNAANLDTAGLKFTVQQGQAINYTSTQQLGRAGTRPATTAPASAPGM